MSENNKTCIEFAVFKVSKENSVRVIELSKAIFSEMNTQQEVITSYQILQKTNITIELRQYANPFFPFHSF